MRRLTAVELAIAAAIEAMTVLPARGDGDRCDAGHSREVRVALKPLDARGLPNQDRRGQRPAISPDVTLHRV